MLQIAIHFYEKGYYKTNQPAEPGSRRKEKMHGYKMDKYSYNILKIALGELKQDIPRSRVMTYRYITLESSEKWRQQGRYFVVEIDESLLPRIETVTKRELNPSVYLWRDGQWWTFPHKEIYDTGETAEATATAAELVPNEDGSLSTIEKKTRTYTYTKSGYRTTDYKPAKGPGFLLANPASTENSTNNPAGFPTTITGNGMVLEWKSGYEERPPIWWIRDEYLVPKSQSQTYKNYSTLKSTYKARWSRRQKSWYYTGGEIPPQAWLELVGYEATQTSSTTQETEAKPTQAKSFYESMREKRKKQQQAAMLKMSQQFTQQLAKLMSCKALPAMATPSLDDPWS